MHKKVFEKAMTDMQKKIGEMTNQLKEKDMEIKLQASKIREILNMGKEGIDLLNREQLADLTKLAEPWRIHTTDPNSQLILDKQRDMRMKYGRYNPKMALMARGTNSQR